MHIPIPFFIALVAASLVQAAPGTTTLATEYSGSTKCDGPNPINHSSGIEGDVVLHPGAKSIKLLAQSSWGAYRQFSNDVPGQGRYCKGPLVGTFPPGCLNVVDQKIKCLGRIAGGHSPMKV